jgi:hypothetical protein
VSSISGGSSSVCSCFKGTFTLTQDTSGDWSSAPITGCDGQTNAAYLRFSLQYFGIGITDQTSTPCNGACEGFRVTGGTCSPLNLTGDPGCNGNNSGFCQESITNMAWSLTD